MDYPRPTYKALLPARRAAGDELQVETHCTEQEQSLYLAQSSIPGIYPRHLRRNPPLPISNYPLLSIPPVVHTIPFRRRPSMSRDKRIGTRVSPLLQIENGISPVDEINERSGDGEHKASTSASYSPISDPREKRHNLRIEALTKELEPMCADNGSAVVLLCWGDKSCCSILPVPVLNTEDEVATWGEINRAWYARRGHWRKYLPLFSINRVDIVEISMLGSQEASKGREKGEYIGMYTESDISAEKKRLQHSIDNTVLPWACSYDRYTGEPDCALDCECFICIPEVDGMGECPVTKLRAARRKLSLLNTLGLMRHVFSKPALAASNDFLEWNHLICSHRDVLSELNSWRSLHCPGLIELKFRGIAITEGWKHNTSQVFLPLMVIAFLAVVVAAKFVFGWNTAWTVGGFFIALVTLLWMWATHMAS